MRSSPPNPRPSSGSALVLNELVGVKVDPEVAKAVEAAGKALAAMGHTVEPASADMGGEGTLKAMEDLFFFAFDSRLDGYAKRAGTKPGPDTLEPVIWSLYQQAKEITPARFMASWAAANTARRKLGAFYTKYDIWLSPTTSRPSEPWGNYNLSKPGVTAENNAQELFKIPCQYTIPHNIMGTPAMSLPLAMHSSGVPIGVQIAGRPADEHLAPAARGRAGAGDAVARPRAAAACLEAVSVETCQAASGCCWTGTAAGSRASCRSGSNVGATTRLVTLAHSASMRLKACSAASICSAASACMDCRSGARTSSTSETSMIFCQSRPGSSSLAGGGGNDHVAAVFARLIQAQQQRERGEAGDNGHPARDLSRHQLQDLRDQLHVEAVW